MDRPRWPMLIAGVLGVLVIASGAFVAGRASGPDDSTRTQDEASHAGGIRVVGGVPVGVDHSRAGALAAADNYVATSSETVIQDPLRYEHLVRAVYAPSYQATARREGREVRNQSPKAIARYDAGARALSVVAARRLDSYDGTHAVITTWRAGVIWGGAKRSEARWFLTATRMRWNGQRWLVQKIEDAKQAAPAPVLIYSDPSAVQAATFDARLRGMTAPSYGVSG